MVLAFPIGWTVSLVLLGLVYYGLFTPIGLVFRLVGRDALQLRPRHRRDDLLDPARGPGRRPPLLPPVLRSPMSQPPPDNEFEKAAAKQPGRAASSPSSSTSSRHNKKWWLLPIVAILLLLGVLILLSTHRRGAVHLHAVLSGGESILRPSAWVAPPYRGLALEVGHRSGVGAERRIRHVVVRPESTASIILDCPVEDPGHRRPLLVRQFAVGSAGASP